MRRLPFVFLLSLILLAAACGGAASPAPATPGIGDQPTDPPSGGQPTDVPPSDGPTAEPTDDGSAGTGGWSLADLVAGQWTSGSLKFGISGSESANQDLDLQGGGSITAQGFTLLVFGNADPWVVQLVFASAGGSEQSGFAISGPVITGGSPDDGVCTFDLSRRDSSAVEGTVECNDAPALTQSGTSAGMVDIKLSFKAQR